jgi:hypothetical protein
MRLSLSFNSLEVVPGYLNLIGPARDGVSFPGFSQCDHGGCFLVNGVCARLGNIDAI